MPLMFNTLLEKANVRPEDVRLVRHKDKRADKGRTPYDLWCNEGTRYQFERYQSCQRFDNHGKLDARYWAVFLGTPNDETLFVGLYRVKHRGPLDRNQEVPTRQGEIDKAGSCDEYHLTLLPKLSEFIGKLVIDWGPAKIAWIQYASNQNQKITELRPEFKEPDFPGALSFTSRLSALDGLPISWKAVLKECAGIYLLTCPKTGLQYVGKADGKDGFWGRWQDYVTTCHGGNVGLKRHHKQHHKRPGSCDFQVSILEVAGSSTTEKEMLQMEEGWITRLRTRHRGLNE